MARSPFTFADLAAECRVELDCYRLDEPGPRALGARVYVPTELRGRYPYSGSAYAFLQELRSEIRDLGLVEFPELPLNPTNHTLAQRSPTEHGYSKNPYLTTRCQQPHQDTPPYPTAFWLPAARCYSATWVLSATGAQHYYDQAALHPGEGDDALHRRLVPELARQNWGVLVNHSPGLVLVDNSTSTRLYHARTCCFEAVERDGRSSPDTPMYAFNEVGLLEYLTSLDERRGTTDLCAADRAEVARFGPATEP